MQFFKTRGISSGERFFIEFQKEEEVQGQYNAIKKNDRFSILDWEWPAGDYTSYSIDIDGTNLIVAAALDGVKEDFLTGLRNIIDGDEYQFKNHAILFLLHKPLDSLINGSDNLCKGGMPLHLGEISKSIKEDIKESSSLSKHQKKLLDYTLQNKTNSFFVKRRSLFDLEVFLEVLGVGSIDKTQYTNLGLFKDSGLSGVLINDAKNIKNRFDQNSEWHDQIQNGHEYGHVESYLEKTFSDKGVAFLEIPEKWKLVDYVDLVKWAEEKQKQEGVDYINDNIINTTPEGSIYWDKADGDSAAKSRRRNICMFNPEQLKEVTFCFEFTGRIYSHGRKGMKNIHIDQLSTSGKVLTAKIKVDCSKGLELYKFGYDDPNSNNSFIFKIMILPFEESLLSGVKTCYVLDTNKPILEVNPDGNIIFNDCDREKRLIKLENNAVYDLKSDFKLELNVDEVELPEGKNDVDFTICGSGCDVCFRYALETQKPEFISGLQVWLDKRQNKSCFNPLIYFDNKKRKIVCLEHGIKRYYVQNEFRDNIKREQAIIDTGGLCWLEPEENRIEKVELELPGEIEQTYMSILNYYRDKKQLPSTSYLEDDLVCLYNDFIDKLIDCMDLRSRESLSPEIKTLSRLGTLSLGYGEGLILFTPLHPVNIAYQLTAIEALGDEKITHQIAERLGATNILPYLKKSKNELYAPIGQSHSPEWIYYSNTGLGSQTIAKKFVPILIKQKIKEFTSHFSQLFIDSRRPIRINLINMGDCSEALTGIFEYYQDSFTDKKHIAEEDVSPVIVHIYANKKQTTKFEELSQYTDQETIEREFKLNLNKYNDYDPQVWLDIFHSKVHFYSSTTVDNNYDYAHISFFQFDSTKAKVSNYDIEKVPSGFSLGGLISDLSSVNENNNYRSCFGFKGEDADQNKLTKLARLYNPLIHVAGTDDIYDDKQTTATVINANVRNELEGIYQASQWVTFIDPKVDLSFFKESKDVVIIHYSDQYNNASGYDAITVTKKCSQYQQALALIMEQNSVPVEINDINRIIDIFNAVNGDWLLRLNSQKNRGGFKEEKISILAAVKAGLAFLDTPDIIWIPVSLEEILRVSGGVGLSQKDGLFSSKNLGEVGKTSDDILFIGLQRNNDKVKMHLLPVEVKVGNINSQTVKDAKIQALHTRDLLEKHLSGNDITGKIYRNFFAKMALVGASKLSLYDVWPEYCEKWDRVNELRHHLLNDQFSLAWDLDNIIGKAGFISFKQSTDFGTRTVINNTEYIYHVELLNSDTLKFLTESIDSIKDEIDNLKVNYVSGNDTAQVDPSHLTVGAPTINNIEDCRDEDPVLPSTLTSNQESKSRSTPKEPLNILFGHHANNGNPINWFPTDTNKVMHPNMGIIGTMGTGKTQFTKSMIAQLAWNDKNNVNGKKVGILIFDYKGDYIKDDFVQATNAKVYNLHCLPYNPLAIIQGDQFTPMLPLHTANNIKESIATAFGLGVKQKQKLRDCIMAAYETKGINKGNRATWNQSAPTISEMCEIYLNDPDVAQDSLYAAISNLYDFEIFESDNSKTKSLYEIIDGVTVINLSGYDSNIQNLVVAITLDLFYTQMQRTGHSEIAGQFRQLTKFVLVDEADNFLGKDFASIKKIMKEGREFGVGTILSTQFLNHFSTGENEYSNYILTWVVHRVNEIRSREIESLFNANDKDTRDQLISRIKELDKHHSIVNLAGSSPVMMKDKAFWELQKGEVSG